MISFDRENRRIKYRIAGLCVHDGYVLLTRADQDDYWIPPGGRVELLEDTRTTLRRKLIEETGYEAEIKTCSGSSKTFSI
ncbi:MAG: NUDIX domain-containing protein [Rubrobacter sp.]|nr:NUDIX domain-containing protein [Rubrobacter sp.]